MIPTRPRYGNCWAAAMWIRRHHGGQMRRLRSKRSRWGHWIVKLPHGDVWHFIRLADVLPWPLCLVLFWGRFERRAG